MPSDDVCKLEPPRAPCFSRFEANWSQNAKSVNRKSPAVAPKWSAPSTFATFWAAIALFEPLFGVDYFREHAKNAVFLVSVLILRKSQLKIRGGLVKKVIVDCLPSRPNLPNLSHGFTLGRSPKMGLPQSLEIACTFDSVSESKSIGCEAESNLRDSEKVARFRGGQNAENALKIACPTPRIA